MDRFRFADFTLDRRKRQLFRGADVVRIGTRAFDVLEVLVANRDRIVTRDEIMDAVWPGTVVGDNNLNVQVGTLRRLLGPEAIVTVAGRVAPLPRQERQTVLENASARAVHRARRVDGPLALAYLTAHGDTRHHHGAGSAPQAEVRARREGG